MGMGIGRWEREWERGTRHGQLMAFKTRRRGKDSRRRSMGVYGLPPCAKRARLEIK